LDYRADEKFDGRTETFLLLITEETEVLKAIKSEKSKLVNTK
jgi:hypothetical protein